MKAEKKDLEKRRKLDINTKSEKGFIVVLLKPETLMLM